MKIVLKDKTEIQNAMVGQLGNRLELTMSKTDAVANISKFMTPEIMSEIEFYHGVWKTIYIGFTWFTNMDNPKEDEMRVWMEATGDFSVSDPIPLVDDMYIPKGDLDL